MANVLALPRNDEEPLISQGLFVVPDGSLVDRSIFVAGRQYKAATVGLFAPRLALTNSHFCTPLCIPPGGASLHPLAHVRQAAVLAHGLIFFSTGASSRWATSISNAV